MLKRQKAKHFIRSHGVLAKTDALDVKALVMYGQERWMILACFQPLTQDATMLFQLVQGRSDLKQMLVAEKNRLQGPNAQYIKSGIRAVIRMLTRQLEGITQDIQAIIRKSSTLNVQYKLLKAIPGIGDIVAFELLILLPELGELTRRQIASLAGLAPIVKESVRFQGYRRTGHGRWGIIDTIFIGDGCSEFKF